MQLWCQPLSRVRRWEHWALVFRNLPHSVMHIKSDGCSVFVGQESGQNRPSPWHFTHFRLSASWKYNLMLLLHVPCVTWSQIILKIKYCVTLLLYLNLCHLPKKLLILNTTNNHAYLLHRMLMLVRTTPLLFRLQLPFCLNNFITNCMTQEL